MSKTLCRRHLESYEKIGIKMEVEWIKGKDKPRCSYPSCRLPAVFSTEIKTGNVIS